MKTKFYKCPHCGNVIAMTVDSDIVPVCCREQMTLLDPKSTDETREKHVPVLHRKEDGTLCVKIGEMPHPMTSEHHICFVAAESADGIDVHYLDQEKPAETTFCTCGKTITAVYGYCNLHGLWVNTEMPE